MEGQNTWDILWAIIVMVLVLVLCYFVTKFIASRGAAGGNLRGNYMRILDRIVISRDKFIMLVEVGDQVLLVGVTNQGIATLGTVEDLQPLPEQEKPPSFTEALKTVWTNKKPIKPRKDVEEFISRDAGFEKILRNATMEQKERQADDFAAQLDDMDEKMRARGEKMRSKREP